MLSCQAPGGETVPKQPWLNPIESAAALRVSLEEGTSVPFLRRKPHPPNGAILVSAGYFDSRDWSSLALGWPAQHGSSGSGGGATAGPTHDWGLCVCLPFSHLVPPCLPPAQTDFIAGPPAGCTAALRRYI